MVREHRRHRGCSGRHLFPSRPASSQGRARSVHAALDLASAAASAVEPARRADRYSSSRRVAIARQYREPAPTLPRSGRPAQPPAGTGAPPARPRSSVRLPLATSVLRHSLNPVSPKIIPVWLMGHRLNRSSGMICSVHGRTRSGVCGKPGARVPFCSWASGTARVRSSPRSHEPASARRTSPSRKPRPRRAAKASAWTSAARGSTSRP